MKKILIVLCFGMAVILLSSCASQMANMINPAAVYGGELNAEDMIHPDFGRPRLFESFKITETILVETLDGFWPVYFADAPATLIAIEDISADVFKVESLPNDDFTMPQLISGWPYREIVEPAAGSRIEPGYIITADTKFLLDPGIYVVMVALGRDDHFIIVVGDVAHPFVSPAEEASSWAAVHINTAIAANLVPWNLQYRFTRPITRAEFSALAVRLYETVTGREITERTAFRDTADINVWKMGGLKCCKRSGQRKFCPR